MDSVESPFPFPTYDVDMQVFTYGGEVMGRLPDGRAVFVPFTLPGERVRIHLVEEKRGYARAELLEVLVPSPQRITPRCPHVGPCGGCHYQHLPYPLQLEAKQAILADQLRRLGGLDGVSVEPVVPSPQEWYYRNQVQFHLTPEGRLGYQSMRTNDVLPIQVCFLPEEYINSIWPVLEVEPVPGLSRIGLRQGSGEEALLVFEGDLAELPEFVVEELPVSAVYATPEGPVLLAGGETLEIEVLGRAFSVSAESFFQVNTPQAGAMVEHILAQAPLPAGAVLLELYSGVGLFSAFLAPRVARLAAVESSPSACRDFETNLDEFDNVELYEAPVEEALPYLDLKPDVILMDPPRSGLGKRVTDQLVKLGAPTLVYVSCDPSTLARDAKALAQGGYHAEKITPFDLFPQTFHIESISIWKK